MKTLWVAGSVFVLVGVVVGAWWWLQPRQAAVQPDAQPSLVLVDEGLPQGQEWRQDFTFADMDGDGMPDLVTAPPRKSEEPWPHIFLRKGDRWEQACTDAPRGGFPAGREYIYGGVAVADFDGDDFFEIALAMHETGLRILKSQRKGPCGPWVEQGNLPEQMLELRSRAIVAADMDRDGRMDIVALAESPPINAQLVTKGITIFFNEATGWRPQELLGSENLYGDDIAVGEVNGDGIPDIAIGILTDSRSEFVWLSDGAGWWKAASKGFPQYIVAWSARLIDLDGDGHDELLLGVGGAPFRKNAGPRVYRWNGKTWEDASSGLPQVSWVSGVTAADLDGNGQRDVVAADMYTGIIRVYKRSADGVWGEESKIAIPDSKGLRNYKVRTWTANNTKQELIVANYAGGSSKGRILTWAWQ